MPPITTSVWASDLSGMVADLPTTARFIATTAGTEFTCAATELSTEEMLVICGNDSVQGVRIVHAADAFTVTAAYKPQARINLKFPNPSTWSNYEIVSISLSPDLVAYETTLKADSRA
jgi:hypothetical protein